VTHQAFYSYLPYFELIAALFEQAYNDYKVNLLEYVLVEKQSTLGGFMAGRTEIERWVFSPDFAFYADRLPGDCDVATMRRAFITRLGESPKGEAEMAKYDSLRKLDRNLAILKYFQEHPGCSNAEVGKVFHLPRQRIFQIHGEMLKRG
jgi:hypothetical protein